jgi:hypothetical protein
MTELLILIGVLFASLIGTTTGFGTSTILVPLLLLFYPLSEVLLFVGVIHWFGNLWKMYFFRNGRSLALLFNFGIAGAIGSFLGARLTIEIPQDVLQRVLGLFLLAYSIFLYWKPESKLKITTLATSLGGLLSGIFSGIFGVGGAIRGAFLNAFGLKKATYLFTAGAIGLMIDSSRIMTYWHQGFKLSELRFSWLLLGIPTSLLGAWIAKRLVDYLPQQLFKTVVTTGLLILGFYYLVI